LNSRDFSYFIIIRELSLTLLLLLIYIVGHNWGSEHDPDSSECSPSSKYGGKFIMYTYSVSGIDSNNRVSRQLMNLLQDAVLLNSS